MTNLTFYGATGQVTGSCYLLETGSTEYCWIVGYFKVKETEKQMKWISLSIRQA